MRNEAKIKLKADLTFSSVQSLKSGSHLQKVDFIYFKKSHLLLEILGNMGVVIIYYPVCVIKNFEINLSFAIKPFFYITKMSGQKYKYLKSQKSF